MYIDYDIEDNPLQIMTDSVVGSEDLLRVGFYTQDDSYCGDMCVKFTNPPQYWVGSCNNDMEITFTAPEGQVRTWTITKTETSVVLACNGVEIVNYLFSESTRDVCVSYWSRDVVKMKFMSNNNDIDTASNKYRAKTTGKNYIGGDDTNNKEH